MLKFFGIKIDPWIPALNYKKYFFRDNSGIIEFNEIELFYKNELIKVVGGMDRAKKFGFMTVKNFMAEVKVRISSCPESFTIGWIQSLISIFAPMGLYMNQNRKKLRKGL